MCDVMNEFVLHNLCFNPFVATGPASDDYILGPTPS